METPPRPLAAVPTTAPAHRATTPAAEPPPLDSTQLLQGCRTVTIRHNGECYRLQATRQGKLILTK